MDRADPRFTSPYDRPYAKMLAEQRRHYWRRIAPLTDVRLLAELDNAQRAAFPILDNTALKRLARRSGAVVHYRMVRRECFNRMKRSG